MKLDVKALTRAQMGQSEVLSVELYNEKLDDGICAERIWGSLKLTRLEDEILAQFTGKAKVTVVCDRCAEEYKLELAIKLDQEYVLDKGQVSDERLPISNQSEVEFLEPLRQEIIATLPVKKLCSKDCAGICPGCGSNLNTAKCLCKNVRNDK